MTLSSASCHHGLFDTRFGRLGLAWGEAGLRRLVLPDRDDAATLRRLASRRGEPADASAVALVVPVVERLRAYFAGEAVDFSRIGLDFTGISAFEAGVYRALRGIGHGRTTTYGALARAVGAPDAARAVGMAMGRNPWPVIVPCHRVLAAAHGLGGFSAPGGTATKRVLLRLEGVELEPEQPMLPGFGG